MGKSKNNNKSKGKIATPGGGEGGGGLDEIDSLFAHKKRSRKQLQEEIGREEECAKQERTRRKQARLDEEADDVALRGAGASAICTAAGPRKGDAAAPAALHARAKKLPSLTYTRADAEQLNTSKNKEAKDAWAADGKGGVFNGEGFTGRRDDGGHRVFKAHLMNRQGFGDTPDCPFDCDCCFI